MAPGLERVLVKRQAGTQAEEDEYVEDEQKPTTLATHIFGKHLHKVRVTTASTTTELEGNASKFESF